MPNQRLARFVLLPELKLISHKSIGEIVNIYVTEKIRVPFEICPKCASPSSSIYDKRVVSIKDEPLRGSQVLLKILKRRYFCKPCKKPFTEPVNGIMPKRKTTQRFRRSLLWAAENFSDLKKVKRAYKCSTALLYKILYEQLELKLREYQYPWPQKIGIDEHFFSRNKGYREFATVFTDMTNKRLREVCLGKSGPLLFDQIKHIEGRENVKLIALDLSDTYKSFCKSFFPNAELVADKFHVLRLLTNSINRHRKQITGDKRNNPIRRLLLRSGHRLEYFERKSLWTWLREHDSLRELYFWKERLHELYRTKGYNRAKESLIQITDQMAKSLLPEIKTLRRTLMRWREEVLNYFKTGLTNARTEGFNNVAKLVQKRAYGYKSFRNYRLRLLSACA
jgi:transposase